MKSDTDFAGGSQVVGDDYATLYGAGLPEDEGERYTGRELLPRFDKYVVKFEGGKAQFSKDGGSPAAHVALRVVEGPEGTAGALIFANLWLTVSKNTRKDGEVVAKTPKEYAEQCEAKRKELARVARVGRFTQKVPQSFEPEDVAAYAAQFGGTNGDGFLGVIAVGVQKETAEYDAQNFVIWRSLAAPSDPVEDRKHNVIPGVTAIDDARAAIQKYAAKGAKKGAGRTAGSFAGQKGVDPAAIFNV